MRGDLFRGRCPRLFTLIPAGDHAAALASRGGFHVQILAFSPQRQRADQGMLKATNQRNPREKPQTLRGIDFAVPALLVIKREVDSRAVDLMG